MECDRIATQEALIKERERVLFLRNEIDTLAYKRMYDLPLAVQKGRSKKFLFQEVSTQKLCSLVVTRTSKGTFAISNYSLV